MNHSGQSVDVASAFLAEIFEPDGEILEVGEIAVWNKANHLTELRGDAASAAKKAMGEGWRNISYFGVCTRSPVEMRRAAKAANKKPNEIQGSRDELAGMPGLWVDIDVTAPGHRKAHLCPSIDEALAALARAIPHRPTITVRTGGGIHAYWLFEEGVVEFAPAGNERARETMEMLCRSFQVMVRDELRKQGWSDDQTWPLPRVMRIPGGTNVSHGEARPVTWEKTGPRYSIDDLQMVVPAGLVFDLKEEEKARGKARPQDLRFEMAPMTDALASATEERMEEFCVLDEELEAVWKRKRRNLTSQSEIDMSLATRLATVNTPPQFIVDVMRASRFREDPGDRKVDRMDYYLVTLERAMAAAADSRAAAEADVERMQMGERAAEIDRFLISDGTEEAPRPPLPPLRLVGDDGAAPAASGQQTATQEPEGADLDVLAEADAEAHALEMLHQERAELRVKSLASVNEAFGLSGPDAISEISRELSHDVAMARWRFTFENGRVMQVSSIALQTCARLRAAVFEATGLVVDPFSTKKGKARQWAPVMRAANAAAVIADERQEADRMLGLGRQLVTMELTSGRPFGIPGGPDWARDVRSNRDVALWCPAMMKECGGRERPGSYGRGVLILRQAWVEAAQYSAGEGIDPRAGSALLRSLIEATDVGVRQIRLIYPTGVSTQARTRAYVWMGEAEFTEGDDGDSGKLDLDRAFAAAKLGDDLGEGVAL